MQAEALAKIKAEMDGNKNNPYIQVIGDFLLRHLEADPGAAEKILAADKTIGKSLDAMKEEARKKQHNGMAILTDAEGFAIALKYFGIEGEVNTGAALSAPASRPAVTVPVAKPAAPDFDVKLDDFL
ncbi:hypothetical protein P4V33_01550 [Brevibacillus borstelensis]|uniref:hypothetical protein n=1 Tax=Brevibacillus borstelensis TaxID=45462 RepID=UPI002E1F6CE6|nr:hypothetical protein [Brevibacillus borstelensis]